MYTNFYYTKYLKYKSKYLKYKEQNGGTLGTQPCPEKYTNQSVYELLEVYNCTYHQIPKKILEDFDYEALKKDKHQITIADLKSRKFPVKFFKDKKYPLAKLIEAGYLVFKLIEAGFTYKDMKDAGISLETLNKSGLDKSPSKVKETFKMLKEAGYTINDFFDVYAKPSEDNYKKKKEKDPENKKSEINLTFYINKADIKALQTINNMKMAGFLLEDIIKLDKFTKKELKKVFTVEEVEEKFKDKEYTLEEILAAIKDESGNFDSTKLKKINENRKIDLNLIKSHLPFSILYDSNYSKKELLDSGFLPNQFISLFKERKELTPYYNLTRLKKFFTLENLLTNKISLEDILQIGYEPFELKELSITADLFKEIIQKEKSLLQKLNCYTIKELKDAGYDEKEILKLDYPLEELKGNGYTLNVLKNILPQDYLEQKILQKFTLDEIIENYNGDELRDLLKNIWVIKNKFIENKENIASKLIKKGFTVEELYYKFHFKIIQILNFGFDINELKILPNSILQLIKEGYNLEYFKSNNFSVKELKENGRYTVKELKDAGYLANELKDYFHIKELKDAGYNISEMIEAGFSPLDLYLIGFSKEDIIKKSGRNEELELVSRFINIDTNSEIADEERIKIIQQILGIIKNLLMTLYYFRENKVPLYLIITALGNLENIIYNLKYVFIPDDFVNDKKINLDYYAAEFPINDLLFLKILECDLLVALGYSDIQYSNDKKLEVKRAILNNINLKQLLEKYTAEEVEETLDYYFWEQEYVTPLHPWYKSLKKIDDEVYKKKNGLIF